MALLNDLLETRHEELVKLQAAKANINAVEDEIKHQLIAEQWTEFLSVDWKKLTRNYRGK